MKPFANTQPGLTAPFRKKTVITKEELAAYADMVDDDFKSCRD